MDELELGWQPGDALAPRPDPELVDIFGRLVGWLKSHGCVRPDDENVVGTERRAAKGFLELGFPAEQIEREKARLLAATFPSKYDGMILSKHNLTFGMCPHHLLPVIYKISLAYIPNVRVLGLSKLSRLAKLVSRSPILQEDLTARLADALYLDLESRGSAVFVEGLHMCMAARGVEVHEARAVTSEVRGVFREQQATRMEFLDLVRSEGTSLV